MSKPREAKGEKKMTLRKRILEEIAKEAARADRALNRANKAFDEGNIYREEYSLQKHQESLAKIEAFKDVLSMMEETK